MSSQRTTVNTAGSFSHQSLFVPDRPGVTRKVAKEDFQGVTPPGLISVLFALPSDKNELHLDIRDAIVRRTLNVIRDRCQVWIDGLENEGYIVISARKIQHVRSGLQEIREWMLVQSRDIEPTATTLVHRIGGNPRFCIDLKLTDELGLGISIADGWRGVAQVGDAEDEETTRSIPNIPSEDCGTVRQIGENAKDVSMPNQLLDAIKQIARGIRPSLGQKYVRVHFGVCTLSKRKARDKTRDEYTTSDFQKLMRSAVKRGHVSFRLCFGDENLTKKILQHTHMTDNPEDPSSRRFVALDATIDHLRDVKPRFCLVFFSGNYRIEMDIHVETANIKSATISRGAKNLNLPTASSPRVFRFNKTVDAEVAVACPDMKVDWQLSIDSDLSADKVYDRFCVLAKELRFDPVPKDGMTFPVAHASRTSLKNAKIDSVACKAIWTFECLKAPWLIDFTQYYDWDAHPLAEHVKNSNLHQYDFSTNGRGNGPIPRKSCAVSLYGEDWDEKMRNMNTASCRFADDFINLFDRGPMSEQYLGSLLQEIEFLLDITTQAAAEAESLLDVPNQAPTEPGRAHHGAAQAAKDVESCIESTA